MLAILAITVPIYVLIGLGYVAGRSGAFGRAEMRVLGRFVVNFALPAMLFRALSQRPPAELFDARYLAAYAGGSLATFALGFAFARRFRHADVPRAAFVGMGMAFPNSGYVGYPIVVQWLGEGVASSAVAQSMLAENLLMLPLALAIAEAGSGTAAGRRWQHALGGALRGMARNPLVLSIVAGVVFASLGLSLPAPLARVVDLLGGAAPPLALFVIGGSLPGIEVRPMIGDVTRIAAGKLVLHPLAVAAGVLAFHPADPRLAAAAIAYASVPMLSIYPILAQKHGLESFCAAALLVTTVLSFATISVALWLAGMLAGA